MLHVPRGAAIVALQVRTAERASPASCQPLSAASSQQLQLAAASSQLAFQLPAGPGYWR